MVQEIVKKEFAKEKGQEQANRMFAPAEEGLAPPPHATGAAFDLEFRSLADGKRQELYCCIQNKQIYASFELEQIVRDNFALQKDSTVMDVVANRRILFHCLCSIGVVFSEEKELFTPHPGECWHFGDGDPLSAYLKREPFARYGLIEPSSISTAL